MSFWSDVEATFDIGGVDPQAIYDSASGCRTLSSDLIAIGSALDQAAMGLEKSWKSLGDTQDRSGSTAFQKTWHSFSTSIKEYARHLDTLATQLQSVGDVVRHAQVQMARLKQVAEASAAIIGIATVVTAGVALASAEADVMENVAVATGLMSETDAVLGQAVTMIDALVDAFFRVAAMFTMGAAWDVATIFFTRAGQGLNPFDPRNYSTSDWSNVLMAGDMSLIFGFAAKAPAIKSALLRNPGVGTAVYQAVAQATAGPIWQILVLGLPANKWSTWEKIGMSTAISAVTGGLLGSYGGDPSLGKLIAEPGQGRPTPLGVVLNNPELGLTSGDWVRNGVGLPASVAKYFYFGASAPASLEGVADPGSPPAVPVPDVPLPHVAGLPQGSTLHVVQHEENLSELASGNAALAREIAQLNRLGDDSVVKPGQVVIIPPAGTS